MSTIPASALVSITPGVLSAGGNALNLLGLCLTKSARVPIGHVLSFPSSAAVQAFFGPTSQEANSAAVYFKGFATATVSPSAMLFAQYPIAGAAAYLQSGNVASLGLPAIQAMTGSLTVSVDGYPRTASSLNLSSATSFSAAAALIASGLNGSSTTEASVTGTIEPATASFTASIAGNVMKVTTATSGTTVAGAALSGTGVTAGTQVLSQLSGAPGGIGTYAVSPAQVVPSGTLTAAYGTLDATVIASGTLSIGQTLAGAGVTAGTQITALGTGEGLGGTYIVNLSQTVTSETITATPTPMTVSFDSVSGSFFITSGISGAPSSTAFATGSLAASLLMTQATGAVLSQGSAAPLPGVFMNSIVATNQNWATFFTNFDPDGGSGNAQKQLFAAWVDSTPDRFAYSCWDTDPTPTQSTDAAASLGQILKANESNGTILTWQPSDLYGAAFVAGMIASINFNVQNGRITLAGKGQSGLTAGVSDATSAANLIANGYNFLGAYATATTTFVNYQNGQISGEFDWADTYVNQIWLNANLQQAGMEFLTTVNSVPYNAAGNDLIYNAFLQPITNAVTAGVIRSGVQLSADQISEVNNAAGLNVATTLQNVGWYLLIGTATSEVRQARGTPPITLWYCDGESVQQLAMGSIVVQ